MDETPRVVIDPGVLVSALITPGGSTAAVLDLLESRDITAIVSPALLDELGRVLRRDKFSRYLSRERVEEFLADLQDRAEPVEDPSDVERISRDPNDDYLIALARASGADALVSGDGDLASLSIADPPVLTPRQFLAGLAGHA